MKINELIFHEIKGIIHYLCMDIENKYGQRADVIKIEDITYNDILLGKIFSNKQDWSNFLNSVDFNFDLPQILPLPLPKIPILDDEIFITH